MDPVKLIGVAHLHIFARCPVVVIQGPVVTRFWCLVHWSAKISWTDVIGNNVRRRAQGFGIVEGIAPGTHVLVFTTQVKVRVHVDQIGELIVQISGRAAQHAQQLNSNLGVLPICLITLQSLDKTKCCCSSKNRRASLVEPSPRRSLCSHCAATAALRWSKDSVEAPEEEEELGEALDDDFVRQ